MPGRDPTARPSPTGCGPRPRARSARWTCTTRWPAGWWPSEGIRYRTPGAWVPSKKPVRFEDLVDAVSRDLLHRPASKRLVQTATIATGCKAREKIDRNHALYQWGFPRLLAAVLDSPDHLAC